MAIIIYTYHDPYKLKENKQLWSSITTCPFFCVSQTMVNGLRSVYGDVFHHTRVSTIKNLTDSLYKDWNSTKCAVKQHVDIDNLVLKGNITADLSKHELENIRKSFLFNRDDVFSSIRTMFELKMLPDNIVEEYLTPEQKYIVDIYREILASNLKEHFKLPENFTSEEISDAIKSALLSDEEIEKGVDISSYLEADKVVIHGVHQFSPIMLRTIEELSQYKEVVLLFNYQNQYKNIYQTWVDIYSAFDSPMKDFAGLEYVPTDTSSVSYQGNVLAQNLGKILSGSCKSVSVQSPYEIIEFDNMTEFASYVSRVFENARKISPDFPMLSMSEQIYSADSSVNDILKIYFPEQFGERQFLNYPLGHFFIAIANMWDPETNGIIISDINDIKECLGAGILYENNPGRLLSIYGKFASLFEGSTSIEEMLARLHKVKKNKKHIYDETRKQYINHLSYYSIPDNEITELENALKELDDLATFFYEDFEKQPNNFKEFYKKLKKYLREDILESRDLSEEFSSIVSRVLARLEEVDNINASASFECLKSTMSLYMIQETKPGKSANWIVRNFEQLDGDILRTLNPKYSSVMHFACLSDEDMHSVNTREFVWPLTSSFFEVAQNPVDWKYQVYVKARKEFKNFKRYALIYGLEFNRGKFKLSYVKRDGDKIREPYYLLKMLGVKINKYSDKRYSKDVVDVSDINISNHPLKEYSDIDYYRFNICRKRFLFETVAENNTIFKDIFIITKYLEVWLENEVRVSMQGIPYSEILVIEKLNDLYEEIKKYFPYVTSVNKVDVINNVKSRLVKEKAFPNLNKDDYHHMLIKEIFIYKKLKNPKKFDQDVLKDKFPDISNEEINQRLSEENLKNSSFEGSVDIWCKYCSNREFCIDYYVFPS